MSLDIIESRFEQYNIKTKQDELNALKEICQEIALSGLARAGFFSLGAFQGGTCLRILYGLKRFSEDLDFVLQKNEINFQWRDYLKIIELEFESFGLQLQVKDRSDVNTTVKRAFLKQNSFGKILTLKHNYLPSDKQAIQIKLEIDVNPPEGSSYKTHYLDFPYPFSVVSQDFSSLFASKCHALLCRPFVKGRDWFDFLWYISKRGQINYDLLRDALLQFGPYKGSLIEVNKDWVADHLKKRIHQINWDEAKKDIETFLSVDEQKVIENWSTDLFCAMVEKLYSYLV